MKTIIAGSRTINPEQQSYIIKILDSFDLWKITEVISGMAKGVDTIGRVWAENNDIPVIRMYPDWKKYPYSAGHIRNAEMAEEGDALIAFWNGVSPGTKNMIMLARRSNLYSEVYPI